ncbi:hypothetical protein [Flagellimonas marina]|uniref:Uncharacterized protein n=1 Tax=Flagellimonas marina TaxID=1775168 RepID=A0ABV8PKH9_9FLAO
MEFKSKLIYYDESKNATMLSNANIAAEKINEVFEQVDSLLEIKPTKEKRQQLLENGYSYVMDELREKFPFPKATDEFNFNALGIDPTPLKETLKGLGIKSSEHFLHLDGIKVAVTDKSKEQMKENCSYWTRNDEENQKYDFANKLCEFLNQNNAEIQKYCNIFPGQGAGDRNSWAIFNEFIVASNKDGQTKYRPVPPKV